MQLIKSYKIVLLASVLILFYFIFVNLGFYFDITKKAIKSDIIICLGGGKGDRLQKTISLYKEDFSKSNKIILTSKYKKSIQKKEKILQKHKIRSENIIKNGNLLTTYDELNFAKKIMIQNNYKSILIISSNPHSRRINILISHFLDFQKSKINYSIVGSNPDWWEKDTYYKNKKAVFSIFKEFLKINYNLIYYSLDNIINFQKDTILYIDLMKKKLFNIIIYYERKFIDS